MTETAIAKTEERAVVAQPITPMQMLQIAVEQNADLEKLEKLMSLQDRWEKNEARKAFVTAMAAFKEEAPTLVKNKAAHNSKYASLDQICDAVGPALSQHGLSHRWRMEQEEKGAIRVFCVVTHKMGHSEEVFMSGMPDTSGSKNAIQAAASTVSYLERYTLLAVCGLTARDMDNDGAGGSGGVETVTEEQADAIQTLLESVGADKDKFFTAFNVDAYAEIPAKSFDRAMAILEKKRTE